MSISNKLAALFILTISFQAPASNEIATHKEDVRQVMRTNGPLFQKCYEEGLKKDPKIEGKVVLMWTVGTDGKVISAEVKESELKSAVAEKCMVSAVKTLKFPKPLNGIDTRIVYPLSFQKNK